MTWRLKRTAQCAKCPWRIGVDPTSIPNGYSADQHRSLANTIADPHDPMSTLRKATPLMACHESHSAHCVGWVHNQLGAGNNVRLRMEMLSCENLHKIRLRGEQHPNFEGTLPKDSV